MQVCYTCVMDEIKAIIEKIEKVQYGFKPIQEEAEKVLGAGSVLESLKLAQNLYQSDVY